MPIERFGSTTDLITNLTIFPQIDLRGEIAEMFRVGPSPIKNLQSFLHEATHHWCFHSPVGAALSTLALSARIDAVHLMDEDAPDRDYILERLTRTLAKQRVAHACLGPVAEGLALFSEFDATPRVRTRIRSTVMQNVAFYFGLPTPGTTTSTDTLILFGDRFEGIPDVQRQVDRWLLVTLARSRMTDACIARKANVLVHPLEVKSGYLLGYLFVKTVWDGLARRAPRLRNETDLFLAYLRHYVFQDPRLVIALLGSNGPDDPLDIASSIAFIIDERFDALLDVTPRMIDDFEDVIDSEAFSFHDPKYLRAMQIRPEEDEGAMALLMEVEATTRSREGAEESTATYASALRLTWDAAMAGRAFISMGAMPLNFGVQDGSLVCPDEPELQISVNEAHHLFFDSSDCEARDGSAELLFAQTRIGLPTRILLFTRGDSVTGLAAIPSVETEDLQEWGAALRARSGSARSLIQLSSSVLERIWSTLLDVTELGQIEEILPGRVQEMYLPWSLVHVKDADMRAQLAKSMRERGVRALLETVSEVRALAAISLAVMNDPWLPLLEVELKKRGVDVQQSLKQLTALHENQGFPWVEVIENQVLAVI